MAPHGMTIDQTGKFRIDDRNRLFWDGQLIEMWNVLSLPWWANIAIIATRLGTLGMFGVMVLQALKMLPPA